MRVQLNQDNLQQALALIDQVPGRARIAVARAMNESIAWGRRELARDLSAQTGLPQKTFNSRLRTGKATKAKMTASLWYGGNPVLAEKLGLLTRVAGGLALDPTVRNQQGRAYFGGAFWATMPTGHFGAFMRSSPDPTAPVPSQLWTEGRARTPGTENLPISKPVINLAPSPGTEARVRAGVDAQFQQRAARLLAWELEKAGASGATGSDA